MSRFLALVSCLVGLLALPSPAAAQGEDLRAKRDAKLQEAWFKGSPWTSDYDEALRRSTKTGKVIFGFFTRSYAP